MADEEDTPQEPSAAELAYGAALAAHNALADAQELVDEVIVPTGDDPGVPCQAARRIAALVEIADGYRQLVTALADRPSTILPPTGTDGGKPTQPQVPGSKRAQLN